MDLPPRGASFAPCIRCSSCDAEVPMSSIGNHICSQVPAMPMVEEPEQIQPYPYQSTPASSLPNSRPAKPFVPRIDSAGASRFGGLGELTPASSHGSVGHSPVSPSASKRPPFLHPPRKSTAPVIRRPPSPELLSQDCAFPPFPSGKHKNKIQNSGNRGTIRGRTLTPEASQSPTSFEQDAKRSASLGAQRPRFRQGTGESSRPSTASSSRQPSFSSRAGSRQGSIDGVPPLPALQPSLSRTTTASDPEPKSLEPVGTWPSALGSTQANSVPPNDISPFPELAVRDSDRASPEFLPEPTQQTSSPNLPLPMELPAEVAPREPSYRSKRPPPIDNLPASTISELSIPKSEPSPREPPPPTPTSTLARTLTSLFGRKRNQSTSSKKGSPKVPATDGPRFIALSPDPDPQDLPRADDSSHSSLSTEMVFTPPMQGVQEVPRISTDLVRPENHYIQEPSQVHILQPTEVDESQRDSVRIEKEFEKGLAAVVTVPRLSTVPEQTEDTRRASIDSASSYGSEGFSHSRASSRSTNAINAHSYGSSISTARTTASEDFLNPAFSKLRGPDIVPDSPTDPYLQHGRLAPVPEKIPDTPEDKVDSSTPPVLAVPPIPENEGDYFGTTRSNRQRRPSTPGSSRGVCRGCSQTILAGQKSVSSKDGRLTGRYHKECFVCKTCREPFATADFYVHEDYPYCAHDYHVINRTLCESCGEGIEGHYLETSNLSGNGSKKFHPHCLKCATCHIQLYDDYFEMGGRVYCEKDAFRQMNGPRSPYGTAPSRPSPLNREYINSEEPAQALAAGKFPERRLTKLMTTY